MSDSFPKPNPKKLMERNSEEEKKKKRRIFGIGTAKLSKKLLIPVQQSNQLCQMAIRENRLDFLAFYSTSRES